ncbi:hypothetical protein EG68_08145 [Paragonimus skrjabini miyazakii]|uniref:Uncharacterized protein n=1 Tax=Paragonimus skrjabini miyazakii TaxID=59628 RepID=A0A8S9YNB6_9TREM|nr:hypothetical protein EG68_08145 [Paragonimus skrjabini miyazakii]
MTTILLMGGHRSSRHNHPHGPSLFSPTNNNSTAYGFMAECATSLSNASTDLSLFGVDGKFIHPYRLSYERLEQRQREWSGSIRFITTSHVELAITGCTVKRGLINWECVVANAGIEITLCPATFQIWCNGIHVRNAKAHISYEYEDHSNRGDNCVGQIGFEFPLRQSQLHVILLADFCSPINIVGKINVNSSIFPTQLSHMTMSLGLKVNHWRIGCI